MSGSGRDALADDQEWSGARREFAEVVGRPSQISVSALEAVPDVRECSVGRRGVFGRM